MLAFAHAVSVLVPAGRGQWDLAEQHLHAAEEASAVIANPASRAYTDSAAVHLAYCRGTQRGFSSAAKDLLVDRGGPHEPGVVGWPPQYAQCVVDLRRLKDADEALIAMEGSGPRPAAPLAPATLARVHGQSRRPSAARPGASRLDGRAALRFRPGRGAAAGDDGPARRTAEAFVAAASVAAPSSRFRRAEEIFRRPSATPLLAAYKAELTADGQAATTGSAGFAGPTGPGTSRSWPSPKLVCAGRRDRQIADELRSPASTPSPVAWVTSARS